MPSRYDASTKAKAVRLVREHRADYPTEYAAITAVAGRLGMSAETLRLWIRQDEVDSGRAAGVTTKATQEIRELGALHLEEIAVWEDAAMLTVASWNMHKGLASWQHLRSLVAKQGVLVALVQEAAPPGWLPDGWQTNPRAGERERWRIAVPRYRIDDRDGSRKETNLDSREQAGASF